jgi:hypothetical protein
VKGARFKDKGTRAIVGILYKYEKTFLIAKAITNKTNSFIIINHLLS